MSENLTFSIKPGEDLKRPQSRISNYYAADYEKGTLEVHPQRGYHHISLRVKSADLPYRTAPGSRQFWSDDYFPDVVRFMFDRPVRTTDFPTDQFSINDTSISSGDVRVTNQFSFEVWLTGNSGDLLTGDNTIGVSENIYGEGGGNIRGVLWNGEMAEEVLPRRGRNDNARSGGKLKLDKITLHKTSTVSVELDRLSKRKLINVLDYVHLPASNTSSINGWLYVLYEDLQSFEIEYIDPSPDSVIQSTGSELHVKFSRPIDPQYSGSFTGRVYTTNYGSTGLILSTIGWASTLDYLTITPDVSTQTEGLHQLYLNMDGVYSVDGQKYAPLNQDVWSTYYLKSLLIPRKLGQLLDVDTGSAPPVDGDSLVYNETNDRWEPLAVAGGGPGASGAPTAGPYVTWQPNATLTNERPLTTGVYIDLTNDGTNLIVEADTGQLSNIFNTVIDFTGHTGDDTYHFLMPDINITESQITDLQNYATGMDHVTLSGKFFIFTGITFPFLYNDYTGHLGGMFGTWTNTHVEIDAHIANNSIHLSIDEVLIPESQITDLQDYATGIHLDVLSGNFTGHSGDTTLHYTKADININDLGDVSAPSPSVSEALVWNGSAWEPILVQTGITGAPTTSEYLVLSADAILTNERVFSTGVYIDMVDGGAGSTLTIDVDTTQLGTLYPDLSDFTGHTGTTGTHFTMGQIYVTESQITDLQNYALSVDLDSLSGDYLDHIGGPGYAYTHVELDAHVDDADIHFTEASISITESQISDLQNYATGVHLNSLSGIVTGATGALYPLNDDYYDHINGGAPSYGHDSIDSHIDNVSNPHSTTVSGLDDYSGTSTDGQVLTWVAASSKWAPQDAAASTPTLQSVYENGQTITYNDAVTTTPLTINADDDISDAFLINADGGSPVLARVTNVGLVTFSSLQDQSAAGATILNFKTGESSSDLYGTTAGAVYRSARLPFTTYSKKSVTSYTASLADRVLLMDVAGGNATVYLPAANTAAGITYTFKKTDATANTLTIDGNGSETIDGSTTLVLTDQNEVKRVMSDNNEWWIV